MRELLPEEAVTAALTPRGPLEWQRSGDRLVKKTERTSFRAAVDYLVQVADLAEDADHHPDMSLSWKQVTLELWTHVSGGITQLDLDLAARIDALG